MHAPALTPPPSVDRCATGTDGAPALFPPKDADADTYRAWLARAAWPEVVFGAQLPTATTAITATAATAGVRT
ncbi:hypothetical protein [Knoellia sp. Soil729]|uniref:hypothetical protein n=1 Tax=Knoellia sp. Soil729 TaxID=1736394 RepID=UPI0007142CB5|nr:hypothetical protein [Knoellia sp. Soil729]KRE41259.1 hypothetical protein ASG74_11840 [Knoellia sp. Soil729]